MRQGVVDFHNHLIPGVDDGAVDEEEARQALRVLVAAGVDTVICSPHLEGGLLARPAAIARRLDELDAGWRRLQAVAAEDEFVGVDVLRGAEVRLDAPELDLRDARLRLAGSPFVLVEFPYFTVPPNSAEALASLAARAVQPVLAHPERYVGTSLELAEEWRAAGARLQANGPSFLGRYGGTPRELAFGLLQRGLIDYVCSDYHARGEPCVREYITVLEEIGAEEQALLLTRSNPRRLLDGLAPLPVPPLRRPRPGLLGRLADALR